MRNFVIFYILLLMLLGVSCRENIHDSKLPDPEIKTQLKEEADAFLRLSVIHIENGYRRIGLENLKRAFMKNPYDVQQFQRVTQVLEKEQDWETLVDFYNYAIEKHGNYPILYSKLGEYYVKLGKFHEAENAFKYAIALNTTDPYNYVQLALTYEKLNQPSDALSTWNLLSIILEKIPMDPEEANNLREVVEKNKEKLKLSMQMPVAPSR